MENFDRTDKLLYLEIMEKVESVRHGLWYMMVTRSQGHLAHHVLGDGFKVIEFLRACHKPLWEMNELEFAHWRQVSEPYLVALRGVHELLQRSRAAAYTVQRVWQHILMVSKLGYAGGLGPLPTKQGEIPFTTATSKENQPCDNAPSRDAQRSSPPTSSPAGNTGTYSTPFSGQESGKPTTIGGTDGSEQMNCEQFKRASSANTKHKRGKGWPKRPNPYTKPKKGKG